MTDKEIWLELKAGKEEAFEKIYRQHFEAMYQYGLKITRDKSTIEDSIQELFVEIWNKRENLSDVDSIKPYLFVALKRKLIRSINKIRKSTDTELEEKHFDAELAIDEILIEAEINDEQKKNLASAFAKLSPRQKEILYLKYYSQMNYEDISELMDLNYQSARNLVARAIQSLSKQLTLILLYFFKII